MKMGSLLAVASIAGLSGAASAATVATLTYTDLAGTYTGNSSGGTFSANAVNLADLHSAGDAARIVPVVGTADFEPGFVAGGSMANFTLNMNLGAIVSGMRSGMGSFTSTDANGDTITGDMAGTWQLLGGYLAYNGVLSNVVFHSNHDNSFDGSHSGSFSIADLVTQIYAGAIVNLTTSPGGGFFSSNFRDAATGVNAQVTTVPLPPAAWAGLATLAGVVAVRRIRRK
jgi:hypothetical protein